MNLAKGYQSENSSSEVFSEHLEYIDGLKGLAILMVICFHVSLPITGPRFFPNFSELIEHLSRGVHLFFIISGFSLCHSSSRFFGSQSFSVLSFYIKRFFRIFPLWWAAVIWYHFSWTPPHSLSNVFATLFLYFGFYPDAWNICIVPVGWSLFVEESFYLFFPLWMKLIVNWKNALIAVLIAYGISFLWFEHSGEFMQGQNSLVINPLANYYAFFVGIFLFYLNKTFKFNEKEISVWWNIALTLSCVLGVINIFLYDRMIGTLALVPIFFSSFFRKSIIGKLVRTRTMRLFGSCCYSIYLFHGPLIFTLQSLCRTIAASIGLNDSFVELQLTLWFVIVSAFALLLGKISQKLFERPSIETGKMLIKYLNEKDQKKRLAFAGKE